MMKPDPNCKICNGVGDIYLGKNNQGMHSFRICYCYKESGKISFEICKIQSIEKYEIKRL